MAGRCVTCGGLRVLVVAPLAAGFRLGAGLLSLAVVPLALVSWRGAGLLSHAVVRRLGLTRGRGRPQNREFRPEGLFSGKFADFVGSQSGFGLESVNLGELLGQTSLLLMWVRLRGGGRGVQVESVRVVFLAGRSVWPVDPLGS